MDEWMNGWMVEWMWVRLLFVSRHNFLRYVNVVFDCFYREAYKILYIDNWSAVYVHVRSEPEPDLSRSRPRFFPIASRLFYDGVDDDDDDGDDVTSSFGHCPESCFCVYQNSYCDCAVDDQFLKVLRCPGVGTFLHPEEKLVCPLVHCLRFLRLEKSVHRYFWREIVDVLCYFHILCLMQWVHNFVAPKFHDLLFIRS